MLELEISHIAGYTGVVPDDILLIETDQDYVNACVSIRLACTTKTTMRLWVRKRSHVVWLAKYADLVSLKHRKVEKTSRVVLADRWKVRLPEWLSDDLVDRQGLLDLEVNASGLDNFQDVILRHFVGPIVTSAALDTSRIAEVLSNLIQIRVVESGRAYPVLLQCLQERLESWGRAARSDWEREICLSLGADPHRLWQDLTLRRLLGNYPRELLEFVLPPDRIAIVDRVSVDSLAGLSLHQTGVEQARDQIDAYLTNIVRTVDSGDKLSNLLNQMSGHSAHRVSSCLETTSFRQVQSNSPPYRFHYREICEMSRDYRRPASDA